MSFDDPNAPSVPSDEDIHKEYRRLSTEFIQGRTCRIKEYSAQFGEVARQDAEITVEKNVPASFHRGVHRCVRVSDE